MREPARMPDPIARTVARFEAGTLPLTEWHHREHLMVSVFYLSRLEEDAAIDAIRAGIQRYNAAQGIEQTATSGYHDTLTIFIARGIAAFLRALPEGLDLAARLDRVEARFGDFRAIVLRWFTRERLGGWPARRAWVEPDVRPMAEWLRACRRAASGADDA